VCFCTKCLCGPRLAVVLKSRCFIVWWRSMPLEIGVVDCMRGVCMLLTECASLVLLDTKGLCSGRSWSRQLGHHSSTFTWWNVPRATSTTRGVRTQTRLLSRSTYSHKLRPWHRHAVRRGSCCEATIAPSSRYAASCQGLSPDGRLLELLLG
jgi:hypothetical protein